MAPISAMWSVMARSKAARKCSGWIAEWLDFIVYTPNADIARKFMTAVLNLSQVRGLLSSEHFSVDGTLIEALASMKSFMRRTAAARPGRGWRAQCRARLE
jgi:hypothetical protein